MERRLTHVLAIRAAAIALLTGLCGTPTPAAAQDRGVTAEQVRTSIDRAARYLIRNQRANGSWPERPLYGGGLSPLCTLALLNAGYAPDSEPVSKALAYLRTQELSATYAVSLQTMAFCRGDRQRDLPLVARNVRWLEAHQVIEGKDAGMWALPVPGTPDHIDNSMTHMAMLALYEAEHAGVLVNDRAWQLGRDYWRRSQNADGSWGWGPDYPGSGSMTCAGIASLMAASGHLGPRNATIEGGNIQCCGQQAPDDEIDKGWSWLSRNFSVNRNPGSEFWHSYYLFALERVGRVTGRRFVGDHDWYREAAQTLVAMQEPSGAWPSDMDEEHFADPLVTTSFSLLFLAKGRRPLVVGQVLFDPAGGNVLHRQGLRNLIADVERLWNVELAYQSVDLSRATVEDLLATPVLYLAGREAPQLTAAEKQKLRMYVDRGGFLFADQSCGGGAFDAWFRALMQELFPEPESKLRPLGGSHPVWRTERPVDPAEVGELWGVDASCRTSVIYCPQDLSCGWELGGRGTMHQLPVTARGRVAAALALGANVLSYATNREVKFKDPIAPAEAEANDQPMERGKMYVANVQHEGGCEAASGAAWTLLRLADQQVGFPVGLAPRDVRLTDPGVFKFNLLLFHGRSTFELTPAERTNLRLYVERGGAVLADAICSNAAFTAAFRREMGLVFPGHELAEIPGTDEFFSLEGRGGFNLRSVSRRPAVAAGEAPPAHVTAESGPPRLEGLRVGDRYGVIFSPYDLSCALESRDPAECAGYVRADAARIAINALVYFWR